MAIRRRGGADPNGRSQIAQYLCPDNGIRDQMKRKGVKPKDHMKENYLLLKSAQRDNREIKENKDQSPKDLYKLSQFRNVESRVYENNYLPIKEPDSNYLQKGTGEYRRSHLTNDSKSIRKEVERKIEEARQISDNPIGTPRKAPVPREDGVLQHKNIDFIMSNRVTAQNMTPLVTRTRDSEQDNSRHKSYGKNPKYLEMRKARLEEEKQLRLQNESPSDCPRGMKLMPDEERLSTLENLQTSKTECLKLLQKLPFVIDTISSQKKQQIYETKLREIENAINIFQKPRVFIAKDV